MTWYETEIQELMKSPLVNTSIYVTPKTDPSVDPQTLEDTAIENDVRQSLNTEKDGSELNEPGSLPSGLLPSDGHL